MAEWSRVVATTIKNYMKGFEDETLRNRKVMGLLRQKGRIKYNQSGDGFQWVVKYKQADMVVNNGEQNLSFNRVDRFKTATLDYEGYAITDAMTKREKLKNAGTSTAIVKYFENMSKLLASDIEEQFSEEWYIDGSATGNTGRMSGLETMFATSGTLDLSSTGHATRSANAVDVVGWPLDTYAGLLTTLGNYGGAWNTAVGSGTSVPSAVATHWPGGTGDPEFDFYSPMVVNYTSSSFNGTADTFLAQGTEAIRYALTHSRRNKTANGAVDLVIMDRSLYFPFVHSYDSKERLNVQSTTGLYALGFRDMVQLDGAEITSEYGIPVNVGYGLNLDQAAFLSMQGEIFSPEGPYWDETTRSHRVAIDVMGQFMFQSPRNFFKLAALA